MREIHEVERPSHLGFEFVTRPKMDLALIVVLTAAILDTSTTFLFLMTTMGVEQNPLLRHLISHSILWVPVYLLSRPVLVSIMAPDHRIACATWGAFIGFSMTFNNLSGLISGKFVLYDYRLEWISRAGLPVGVLLFAVYHLKKRTPFSAFWIRFALLTCWGGIAELIEQGFWLIVSFTAKTT